jgi:hypothetical protein
MLGRRGLNCGRATFTPSVIGRSSIWEWCTLLSGAILAAMTEGSSILMLISCGSAIRRLGGVCRLRLSGRRGSVSWGQNACLMYMLPLLTFAMGGGLSVSLNTCAGMSRVLSPAGLGLAHTRVGGGVGLRIGDGLCAAGGTLYRMYAHGAGRCMSGSHCRQERGRRLPFAWPLAPPCRTYVSLGRIGLNCKIVLDFGGFSCRIRNERIGRGRKIRRV